MAVSTDQLLLKLNPMNVSGIQQGLESLQRSSVERQRLAQAREELAETRRRHQEDERLRKISEQNQMQRHTEGLAREREAEQIRRQDTLGKEFAGRLAGGDIAGANMFAALAPSVGMAINVEGMTDGLPRYRIDHDPEATAAREAEAASLGGERPGETAVQSLDRLGALGLDTANERGTLEPPAGMGGEEAFAAAQEASQFYDETGVPMAPPDEEDLLGGIPRDVVDMGALRDMTLRKLRPGMQSLVEAYPEIHQDSAGKTAQGVLELGLPPKETAEVFDQLRGGGPDQLTGQQISADAVSGRRETLSLKERHEFKKEGREEGRKLATNYSIPDIIERRSPLMNAIDVLKNDDVNDDYMAGAPISRIVFGEKGATTEQDVKKVLGDEGLPFLEKIKAGAYTQAFGGLPPPKRAALLRILVRKLTQDIRQANEFMESVYEQAGDDMDDPYSQGLMQSMANVPPELRTAYEQKRKSRGKGAEPQGALDMGDMGEPPTGGRKRPGEPDPERVLGKRASAIPEKDDADGFYTEFSRQAQEAGYDPEKILPLINAETAGKMSADATNPDSGAVGLIQFLNENIAKSVGTTMAELKQMSRVEQIPYVMEYLKTRGITPEHSQGDIYVAISAPGALKERDNHPVYSKRRKSTRKAYDQNAKQWDLDGDGTITRGELYRYGEGARRQGAGDEPMGSPGKVLYSKGSRAYSLNKHRDANQDGHVTRAELDASEDERKRGGRGGPAAAPKSDADKQIDEIMRRRRKAD